MFVKWDDLMDIITDYSIKKGLIEIFNTLENEKKVGFCLNNEFIRNCLERWLDSPEFNNSLKNNDTSIQLRLKANEEFKKEKWVLCYKLYLQAAKFALSDSLELALAFSNRSAVCLKLKNYHGCILDIDICFEILKSEKCNIKILEKNRLLTKLMKRKVECLTEAKQYRYAIMCWQELLDFSKNISKISLDENFVNKYNKLSKKLENGNIFDDQPVNFLHPTPKEELITKALKINNINLPFKSSKLKLCISETKGRHFVASSKINYGELLIFEKPFAFVLLPDYYELFCYNCCSSLKLYSIPCNECSTVLYCSKMCQKKSWESYHCWECKQGTSIFKCIGIAHLALRLTLKTLFFNSENEKIVNLLTHINKFNTLELYQYCLTATLLLLYLKKKTNFFNQHSDKKLDFVGSELLHHMTRLVCNGNAISSHIMMDNNINSTSQLIDETQPRIGTAIFPTSSMLNHSCDPNIHSSNILNYVVIKASRNIEIGEEITNCYGPNFRRMLLLERQAVLKMQYYFDCKCCACMDPVADRNFNLRFYGLVCLSCKKLISATIFDFQDEYLFCDHCLKKIEANRYKCLLSKADEVYENALVEIERNNSSKASDMLLNSLKMFTQVLNSKNPNVFKCQDALAKSFAMSVFLDKTLKTIEQRYGENSIEVAYELDKITDIMLSYLNFKENKFLVEKALAFVKRAMKIYCALLSVWDIPNDEFTVVNIQYKQSCLLKLI
ncbi:SET and MYND domain-containing protein 4-like isoform X2 [Daktulosphaira vitifoliae]|uniref:SET and MYND domain-containing protein 4-like isoform X2 n=1 Tax=Daktulosphaira vitifoliae TaxID=58002 RepID=UPI0021AA145F|nr:SET and MYND domain-containing protein 4-like isoform X2 [Daktulosphaira vitifoliae]